MRQRKVLECALVEFADCFKRVPAGTRSDVERAHRVACLMDFFDGFAKDILQACLAGTDAAPADGVEVGAVKRAAQWRDALGLVLIDVIQRPARVKTGFPAQTDATAKSSECFHGAAHGAKFRSGWTAKAFVLVESKTVFVSFYESIALRGARKTFEDEISRL